MNDQESNGHITRMMGFLGTPFREQRSLSSWLMVLALGFIAVFIWTRILKFIVEE